VQFHYFCLDFSTLSHYTLVYACVLSQNTFVSNLSTWMVLVSITKGKPIKIKLVSLEDVPKNSLNLQCLTKPCHSRPSDSHSGSRQRSISVTLSLVFTLKLVEISFGTWWLCTQPLAVWGSDLPFTTQQCSVPSQLIAIATVICDVITCKGIGGYYATDYISRNAQT